jgi:type I restriction enzyme S subunit
LRLDSSFIGWLCKTPSFVELCKRASEGTTNRVRLQEDRFLGLEIKLPSLTEQRRIVARIGELAAKIAEARLLREAVDQAERSMLLSFFQSLAARAPRLALRDVAPLLRRPVSVDPEKEYPQVAVRSFGRGTFHKPSLLGADVTWQKPFLVKAGDILISNIKAWEGAVAVAAEPDDNRVGSHRYLTCVPLPRIATSRFVSFYLLTSEGLHRLGEASPGSADRNRTLNARALMNIEVPVPPYEQQEKFDRLSLQVGGVKHLQAQTAAELDAMLPAILDRAFKGEL